VSVKFTRIRVKLTLVCRKHTLRVKILLSVLEPILYVLKLCMEIIHLRVKSHCAGENCTLRVEIILVRVEITLVRAVIADLFFSFL
jgi:hypothetical protein